MVFMVTANRMLKTLLFLSLLQTTAYAGVHIVVDLPKDTVDKTVETGQAATNQVIEERNEAEGTQFLFSKAQFAPHISLAFVDQRELDSESIKRNYSRLIPLLQKASQRHSTVDFGKSLQTPTVELWPGRFEVECGGGKKKNYLNVVLKLAVSKALGQLTDDIRKTLETEYDIKQRFPFSAHITLGRICQKDDQPISQETANSIKGQLSKAIATRLKRTAPEFLITMFMLKGHGEQDKDLIFTLKESNE